MGESAQESFMDRLTWFKARITRTKRSMLCVTGPESDSMLETAGHSSCAASLSSHRLVTMNRVDQGASYAVGGGMARCWNITRSDPQHIGMGRTTTVGMYGHPQCCSCIGRKRVALSP